MSSSCLFCRIAHHELPATIRYETNDTIAFDDLHPKAPTHVLVIPKEHRASLHVCTAADTERVGSIFLAAGRVAADLGISSSGYRVIVNCGADGGQEIEHLHVHLLGGKPLGPMVAR